MEAEDPGILSDVPRQVGEDKWSGRGRRPQAEARIWFTLTAGSPLFAVAHGSFDHPGVAIIVVGDPGHGRHCSLAVQPKLQRHLVAGLWIPPVDPSPPSGPLRAVPATISISRSISSYVPRLYGARIIASTPLDSETGDLVLLGKARVVPLPIFFFRADILTEHTWSVVMILQLLIAYLIILLTLSGMVAVPPPDDLLHLLFLLALHGGWQGDGEHLEVVFELVSDPHLSLLLTIFVSTRPNLKKL